MNSKFFSDYARKLDAKFHVEGRNVAVIIDSCTTHPNINNLKAIELVILPPNITSKTQPMDQVVIRALKAFYRTNVVSCYTKYIDGGRKTPEINILEAIYMFDRSWDAVSANTLINCSIKAGISEENKSQTHFILLEENVNDLILRGLVDGDLTVDDYVNIDFEVCTNETNAMTDREIADSISINDYAEAKEETDEESNDVPPKKPKLSDIAHAIDLLECWSLFDNSGCEIRQSLNLISTSFGKHFLETKTDRKYTIF